MFLPFEGVLTVARSLNLANRFEWNEWGKEGMRPPKVPAHPERTYKDGGWQGWVHWLGSGNIKKAGKFAPFGQGTRPPQRALRTRRQIQGRRVAGVGALVGQRRHQEGEQVCAV